MFLIETIALGAFASISAYLLLLRPWHVRWGTTEEEVLRAMPGDALVPAPNFLTTRAVTVKALPEKIWPWLAQMGAGRGGYYSYDRLERALGMDVRSADTVRPDIKPLREGDALMAGPLKMVVREAVPGSHLLLEARTPSGPLTRCTALYPAADGSTRLVTRSRWRCDATLRMLLAYAIQDLGGFIMMRRMLLGIRDRVEARALCGRRRGPQPSGVTTAQALISTLS